MTETLAHGYSPDSSLRELSNEYQHDRVQMVFKNIRILVLLTKVCSALKGLLFSYFLHVLLLSRFLPYVLRDPLWLCSVNIPTPIIHSVCLYGYPIRCYLVRVMLTVCRMLTLMLLVANLVITKMIQKPEKLLKPWYMGTHLRVLGKSYPINTNITGFG